MSDDGSRVGVALGVVTYNRTTRLRRLLESVPDLIDRVFVADNGPVLDAKQQLFDLVRDEGHYDFVLLDLELNAGVGRSRQAIVRASESPFLLMADDDHELPPTTHVLLDQLQANPDLGGVAPSLIEPHDGRVYQPAKDFRVRPDNPTELIRGANLEAKSVERAADHPLVRFDFVPYPTLYRRSCLDDYSWDPAYPLGRTHADFYVGHWRTTGWEFAVSPGVHAFHFPGGDDEYETERRDEDKLREAERYFREKWQMIVSPRKQFWYDTDTEV